MALCISPKTKRAPRFLGAPFVFNVARVFRVTCVPTLVSGRSEGSNTSRPRPPQMLFSSVGAAQFSPARKGWEPVVSPSTYRSRRLSRDSSFVNCPVLFFAFDLLHAWLSASPQNKKGAPISRSALRFPCGSDCGLVHPAHYRAVCASRIILRGRRRVQAITTSRPCPPQLLTSSVGATQFSPARKGWEPVSPRAPTARGAFPATLLL